MLGGWNGLGGRVVELWGLYIKVDSEEMNLVVDELLLVLVLVLWL